MDPTEILARKLDAHPQLRYERVAGGIQIEPTDGRGFAIRLEAHDGGWLVWFGDGGMHEPFDTAEDALEFVAFGLSDTCRLREIALPFLHRSVVERSDGGSWRLVYEVGRVASPFRLSRSEAIFQNTLITGG